MEKNNDTIIDNEVFDAYCENLLPGTLLQGGKYKIVRFIKSGGFGCTYEAVNTTWHNRRVAIKELYVGDFCDRNQQNGSVTVTTKSKLPLFEKMRRKFLEEADRINQLTHTGIVRVTDLFEENGTAYYVMDYIDGSSLRDLVEKQGHLSEPEALHYIRQVAEALQYVHGKKLLHLDIKPGNVMITRESNEAVLIDFGVSKQYDEVGSANTSTLIGYTEGYAPTEQMGREVREFGPATDIYSLGATLYTLLSGVVPPSAGMIASGVELPPLPAKVSATTRRAVAAAMQIKKQDRPQSIAEFLTLLNGKSGGTATTTPRRSYTWLWVAIVGIAVGVSAILGMRGCQSPTGGHPDVTDSTAIEVIADTLLTQDDGRESQVRNESNDDAPLVRETADSEKTKLEEENQQSTSGYINGHEWVDLGLSVKWATCNVGASSPSSYGNYYAWGETSTKSTYTEDNSTTYGKTFADISGDARYDAARANWGGSWRMPTKAECQELKDNCTWTWTTQSGVNGYRVTSKKNGTSIFLPAAGSRFGSSLGYAGESGYYWFSSPLGSLTAYAYGLYFNSSYHLVYWYYRYDGRTVRPVSE